MLQEIVPLPDLEQDMLPGDQVWVTYDLYQSGTWFIGYQVGKLEQELESDGRWRLLSYHYDADAMTVTFKIDRNPNPPARVQLAGGWAPIFLLGLVSGVAIYFAYEQGKKIQYMRDMQVFKDVLESPDIPDDVKAEIRKALDDAEKSGDLLGLGGVADSGMKIAGGVVLLAVVLVLMWAWR